MGYSGFIPLRRGLLEHASSGSLTPQTGWAYVLILMSADSKTGIWWGSSKRLAASYGFCENTARRILERLEALDYIKRFTTPGQHGPYPILIHKYLVTQGAKQGLRLNAKATTDWKEPIYEPAEQDAKQDERQR